MRIDSHQHFWCYDPVDYPWIPESGKRSGDGFTADDNTREHLRSLDRNFLPADLQPLLKSSDIDACIAVQARQSLRENDFLLTLAEQNEFISGIVGWIDLRSDNAEEQAMQLAAHPKAVGVRHVVQDETQPMFMAGQAFRRGISCLAKYRLVYDILIYEHQLADATAIVQAFPDQQFVVDHIAKPSIKTGRFEPWRSELRKLSAFSNVVVKLSGMITEADHGNWNLSQLQPYWQTVLDAFSPNRILFGSDWPVIRLASDYHSWVQIVQHWLAPLSDTERADIWGLNAQRVYLRQ